MKRPSKFHRLKIVEQVIIVSLFSLIIPLIVTGIIVNNINRQALARELSKTAQMLAQTVDNNIYVSVRRKFLRDMTQEMWSTC